MFQLLEFPIRLIHLMLKFQGSSQLKKQKNLSGILNAGALPVHLEEIYSTSVGAQFGEQALTRQSLQELSVSRLFSSSCLSITACQVLLQSLRYQFIFTSFCSSLHSLMACLRCLVLQPHARGRDGRRCQYLDV